MAYLKLELNSIVVTIDQFLGDTLPRIDAETRSSLVYTASGGVVLQGRQTEVYALWNVEAYLPRTEFQSLRLLFAESEYERLNGGDPNISVTDTTMIHEERGARTRATAPGTVAPVTVGAYTLYYPLYNAIIPQKPEARLMGLGYAVRFTLQETDRTTP